MDRKKQERVVVGKTYENIRVLSCANGKNRPKRYNCQCERCGKFFLQNGQEVYRNQSGGCPECRKKDRQETRLKDAEKYIGDVFGELKVIGISGMRKYKEKNNIFAMCKCSCENVVEIPLTRLKSEQIKTCGHNQEKQLKNGCDLMKIAHTENTLITAIDGRRKVNKNSSTGLTGISPLADGRYRAYINFQNKQHFLGNFDNIQDAINARREAEKNIYGDFLHRYANNHPKEWDRIRKHKKDKEQQKYCSQTVKEPL